MTKKSEDIRYEYIIRVNRAIDYIQNHYAENLNLENIARLACFSKYHFHRIFRSQNGETLNEHIRRVRVEKAMHQLNYEKGKSITEIALECGFSSSQNFAKAFKKHLGVTPKFMREKFDFYKLRDVVDQIGNIVKNEMNPIMDNFTDPSHREFYSLLKKINEQKIILQTKVVEMPSFHLAYIRHRGLDKETHRQAFKKLFQWGDARGLINKDTIYMGIGWYNASITPKEKSIGDACITIPQNIVSDEQISIQDIPGGKYAVCHWESDVFRSTEAWTQFYISWFCRSGYKLDARPVYEIYCNNPETHPLGHVIVDLCIPIKPL